MRSRDDQRWMAPIAVSLAISLAACGNDTPEPKGDGLGPRPQMPEVAAQTGAQRLTIAQYRNAIHDLFGESVIVPTALEPDAPLNGFASIGASVSTISPSGVERYEQAAFAIAKQITADAALFASVVPCTPKGTNDLDCANKTVTALGRRIYRRPLQAAEVYKLSGVLTDAAGALGGFDKGLEFAIAAMLQSPHFLYRPQIGEPDPKNPGHRRYTSLEMASRLSFFLWNSIPDEELLAAAEAGGLSDDAGLDVQVLRMIESDRARQGLRSFITEYLRLDELDALSKDPTLFTYFSPEIGRAAREETLLGFEHLVFELDDDYRDIFLTRRTFVNPKLASMYAIPAPTDEGFGEVELPSDSPRIGLLGHISILTLNAHPTSTSSTLRGRFVRQDLLCDDIPPPPVDVNTGLPDADPNARTLRERMKKHLTDPTCNSCHLLMDPIGLGLENFDGIGRYRKKDNDVVIDASGDIDGVSFADARGLAKVVHDNGKLAPCFVRKMYEYATAFEHTKDEQAVVNALTYDFRASGHRVKSLMMSIATSPAFRLVREP
jgi:hypothetical protein